MSSLYGKLSLALFGLLLLVGVVTVKAFTSLSESYRQEATQQLHRDLAGYIVAHNRPLLSDGDLDETALTGMFDNLMAVNPAIEVYLLGPDGEILSYSAPPERIKLKRVRLDPIRRFLADDPAFPLFGDDPRHPEAPKIFSVAPVMEGDGMGGYLYVILAGEPTVTAMEMVAGSRNLQQGLMLVGGALIAALAGGLILFAWLTGRLGRLARAMTDYRENGGNGRNAPRYHPTGPPARQDEIDRLGAAFNAMADRIDAQLDALAQNDALRRELVANVSHDLRTPLTTLHGYLETLLLKDDSLPSDKRREYLQTALGHGERLKKLVADLFELARLEAVAELPDTEPIHLGELIQDVVQHHHVRAGELNITLAARFGNGVPMALGDIGMVQRLLDNLIENALRHTPENGTVTVSAGVENDRVVMTVADTGPGIPKADREQVFERFHRGDTARGDGGGGLGLAIVRRVVSLHNGTVSIHDTPGGGATFKVTLQGV